MEQRTGELYDALNDICTYLTEGSAFHLKAANECRKFAVRGMGRLHAQESEGDKKILDNLVKMLGDRLQYYAQIDYRHVDQAQKMQIRNMDDFIEHFHVWIDRENKFLKALNFAVSKSGAVDMALYQYLCSMTKEVQDEVMRARMIHDRMAFTDFNPHDVEVCSMILHRYFEESHKQGDDINVNLG